MSVDLSDAEEIGRPLPLPPRAPWTLCVCGRDGGWHRLACPEHKRELEIARWLGSLTLRQWINVQAWLELEHGIRPDNLVPLIERPKGRSS